MTELERLGKKVEAVNEKVKNINKALESMENYNYQYNIKLGIPRTLGTWISEWHRETITELCLEIFKATGASELTGQNIDIVHHVQSESDFGPKPIICKFVQRSGEGKSKILLR